MHLIIKARERDVRLELRKDDQITDSIEWKDGNSLSKKLLNNIDKLLKRNKMLIEDINSIESRLDKVGMSTEKIIKAVINTVNYCLTKN